MVPQLDSGPELIRDKRYERKSPRHINILSEHGRMNALTVTSNLYNLNNISAAQDQSAAFAGGKTEHCSLSICSSGFHENMRCRNVDAETDTMQLAVEKYGLSKPIRLLVDLIIELVL